MASDQKIELELALRDTISVTLKTIAENLDLVNKKLTKGGEGITEGVQSLEKIKKHTEGFTVSIKHGTDATGTFLQTIAGIIPKIFAGGPLGLISGVVSVGVAVGKFGVDALRNQAAERMKLKAMSTDLGLSEEKIGILRKYAANKGIAQEDADTYIRNMSQGIKDMAILDTKAPLYQSLMFIGRADLAQELRDGAKNGADIGPMIDKAMKAIDEASKNSEADGRKLADAFKVPFSFTENYEQEIKGLTAVTQMGLDVAKKFLSETSDLYAWTGHVSNTLLDFALSQAVLALDISEKTNTELYQAIRPDITDPTERKRMGLPEASAEELEALNRSSKEKRSLIYDILRSIKRANEQAIEKRQFGGLVQAGRTYEVGERGAESFSSYGGVQPVVGIGEERRMLFRPNRSGAIMPDSNDPFVPPPTLGPGEQAVPGGTAAENYAALQRALRTRPFIGYDERENLPGQSGSNLFGDPEARFLKQQERGMEEQLKLPWWKFPDFGGDYVGPEGQRTGLDSALGGGSGMNLGGEISFINVPDGVTAEADSDGFDNFKINKTRQLEI